MGNNIDTATLLKMLDEMGRPFTAKLDRIEEKLSTHATKDDVTRLREEMIDLVNRVDAKVSTGYVTRDVYESRHGQLVTRDSQLDEAIRQERQERDKDMVDIKDLIRETNAQLEASRRQGESRYQSIEANVDRKLNERTEADLSAKDRSWIRGNQILAWIALAVAATTPFVAVAIAHLQFK